MSSHILLIDGDPSAKRLLELLLSNEGHGTLACDSGAQALQALDKTAPDLVILDLTLPDMDGVELSRRIRAHTPSSHVPILAVTGRTHQADMYEAFLAGVDDYIPKPFDPMELMFRVRSVLRRSAQAPSTLEALDVGAVKLEPSRFLFSVNGRQVPLTKLETKLIHHLMAQPGKVFSADQLAQVLAENRSGQRTRDAAHAHIRHLRQKIEADPTRPAIIVTVGRKGYTFAAI